MRNVVLTFLFFVIIGCFPVIGQEKSKPLRGDQIQQELEKTGINIQKALNGTVNLKALLLNKTPGFNADQVLFTLAKYKIYLGMKYKENDYVKKNLNDYTYFEPGDYYIYKGSDLQKIITDYPESPIADDAGYILSTMPIDYECEGDLECYVYNQITKSKNFLTQFNKSPYVYNLIVDINKDLEPLQSKEAVDNLDPQSKQRFLTTIKDYHKILMAIQREDKVLGLQALINIYKNFDDFDTASQISSYIMNNFPDYNKDNNINLYNNSF